MRIASRLTAVILASMFPLAAVAAYNAYSLHQARKAELYETATRQAQLTAYELSRILEGIRGIAGTAAQSNSVRGTETAQCSAFLERVVAPVPYIASIATADTTGRITCSTASTLPAVSITDRKYFQDALAGGRSVVGEFIIGKVNKAPLLPVAAPTRDDAGNITGVIVATLNLGWLSTYLSERGIPPGGSVTVADRNGRIIARQPLPEKFVGTNIPDAYQSLLREKEPGAIEVTSQDGTRRILGYVPVDRLPEGLYVSVGLSTEQSFAALNQSNWRQLAFWLISGLISLIAAVLTARAFIQRPFSKILDAMSQVQRGNMSARTGLSAQQGELGLIGEEFDRALQQLQAREESVEVLTRELQHRGKNQLSIVLAMARLMGKTATSVEAYRTALSQRLGALAQAQDLLRTSDAEGASIPAVLKAQLGVFSLEESSQVSMSGAPVGVSPKAARFLGLAFHELLTNAMKHGALSQEDGTVHVTWEKKEARITVQWKEHDGPPVSAPSASGFGQTLLEKIIPIELGGVATLVFHVSGFSWQIAFPAGEEGPVRAGYSGGTSR